MSLERQTIYGWPIAIDLFLGGTGAGAFLIGFILETMGIHESFAVIILMISPLMVIVGVVFLLADITMRRRIYRLFSNLKSWTSRGTWILAFFLVSGANYALISSQLHSSKALWITHPAVHLVMGIIAAFFSILLLLYPGFLLGTMSAVPFWNTPILPILFLVSGLANGVALLVFIAPLLPPRLAGMIDLLHMLKGILIMLTVIQAIVLHIFLEKASRGNVASQESLMLLKASRFKGKMFCLGLFVPLCLCLGAMMLSNLTSGSMVSMVAALLFLAGGLYLRHAITHAGVYLPRFSLEM